MDEELNIIKSNQLPEASQEEADNGTILIITPSGDVKQADSGKMKGASGEDGKTPQFQIGTVEKTAPGGDPVVTLTDAGSDASGNPKKKIDFVLPQGEQGRSGVHVGSSEEASEEDMINIDPEGGEIEEFATKEEIAQIERDVIPKSAFLSYSSLTDMESRLLNAVEFILLNASNEYNYFIEYVSWVSFNNNGNGIIFRIKYDTNRFIAIYNSYLTDSLSTTRKRYVVSNNDYYCELIIDWSKIATTGDYTSGTTFKIVNNYYLLNKIKSEVVRATASENTLSGRIDTISSKIGDSDLSLIQSYNRINPANYLANTYFDANGTFAALTGRKTSEAIYCEGMNFIWTNGIAVGFWSKTGAFIQYINSYTDNKVTVPANAYTVRITGLSNVDYFICLSEQHSYVAYGKTKYDIELDDIRNSIGGGGGSGDSSIVGYSVTANGMILTVGKGTVNGVESQPKNITIDAPLTSQKTLTSTIYTSASPVTDSYGCICADCDILSVTDSNNNTLTAGVDYEVGNSPSYLDLWRPYKTIKSLTGSNITGAKITITYKYSRIDRIVVDTDTGEISLIKGYESNTAVIDNPMIALLSAPASNLKAIYNVFVRWGATEVLTSDILDVRNYNRLGYSDKEYSMIDFRRKEKAQSIYPFYAQIAYNNLRQLPANIGLASKGRIVRIGFIGDSRTEGGQIENTYNGVPYGYPYSFARKLNEILGLPTTAFFQNHVNRIRANRVTIGSPEYLQVVNYGKGGNMIQELMHSYYGYFDATTVAGDNTISIKSYNGQSNVHDLVFVNVTNNIYGCYELLDSKCPANLYKNDYTDLEFSLLYDIATRPKGNGGHYELALRSQSDYGNLTTDAQKIAIYQDMVKVHQAMYQRLIDTLKAQNPNVQIIVLFGLPDQIAVTSDTTPRFDIGADNNALMYNIAKNNNLPYLNLSYLFYDSERRLGINKLLTEYPEGNIHPSIYLHNVIGEVLTEYISKEII